jgi:hypothetical protein
VEIDANANAVEHIRARGGRLFAWRDDTGLIRADTQQPDHSIAFQSVPANEFELL